MITKVPMKLDEHGNLAEGLTNELGEVVKGKVELTNQGYDVPIRMTGERRIWRGIL